jgi:hypothetical protein
MYFSRKMRVRHNQDKDIKREGLEVILRNRQSAGGTQSRRACQSLDSISSMTAELGSGTEEKAQHKGTGWRRG